MVVDVADKLRDECKKHFDKVFPIKDGTISLDHEYIWEAVKPLLKLAFKYGFFLTRGSKDVPPLIEWYEAVYVISEKESCRFYKAYIGEMYLCTYFEQFGEQPTMLYLPEGVEIENISFEEAKRIVNDKLNGTITEELINK